MHAIAIQRPTRTVGKIFADRYVRGGRATTTVPVRDDHPPAGAANAAKAIAETRN
jgi:hypothetical protein